MFTLHTCRTAILLALSVIAFSPDPALAQNASGVLPPPARNTPAVTVPAANPVAATPNTQPQVTPPSSPAAPLTAGQTAPVFLPEGQAQDSLPAMAPDSPPIVGATGAMGVNPNGIMQQPQTPKIVTDAINRLQSVQPINLDDMITAQDAINRLDVLIEVEKRQSELKKIRDERNKVSSISSAIPSSAFSIPKSTMQDDDVKPRPKPKKMDDEDDDSESFGSGGKINLLRVTGASGRYEAQVDHGGKMKTLRIGDKLSDGRVVSAISIDSISLTKNKKTDVIKLTSNVYLVRGAEQ